MEIRQLKLDDFYQLRDLLDGVFSRKYGRETRFAPEFPRLFAEPNEHCTSSHWGAFDGDTLCGVLGSKGTNHICLFFTHKDYMGKGVGKQLFAHFLSKADKTKSITVNASDYGIPIYQKLGFEVVGERFFDHGTVHTPMEMKEIK